MLTFGKAKEILAKYNKRGGSCPTDPSLNQFVISVLQQMLWSGTYGNLRQFCFWAHRGCVTLPYELEVIEKVKIDGQVATSFDRWFDFASNGDFQNCPPVAKAMYEDSNYYPTVYDVPNGGSRVGVYGTCNESLEAFIIVKGPDPSGREIVTVDKGEQIVGEKIYIRKGEIRYTQTTFAQITGIVKTPTIGYATLLWIDPCRNMKGFLADYSPLEEIPAYRRYRLTIPGCREGAKINILGRIRLKEHYTDNDLIPFESIFAINLAGQTINLTNNRAFDLATASSQMLDNVIERENAYKKPDNGSPVEYFFPLSGGAINNIIGGSFNGWKGGSKW